MPGRYLALGGVMLDPRAPEHQILSSAICHVRSVRAHLGAYGRRIGAPQTPEELSAALNEIAKACQVRPLGDDMSLGGKVARMLDPRWWSRNLRHELLRENESIEHAQCRIKRKTACYASNHAVIRRSAREKLTREILENLEAVNEDGDAVNLLEAADASVSNPKLRRSELMVRCRGFEEVATFVGHEAVFLTITCPSRFHRFNGQGLPNPLWTGATPSDAQRYLCTVWARIRAEWKRQGISPYGFRVAEPHHDGCPHWHILLFAPAHQVGWFVPRRAVAGREDAGAGLVGVAGTYALADSPEEKGAMKHRFSCERIDTAKGSATGYIAKYISKNIDGLKDDGSSVGLDFASGSNADTSCSRVRTWASVWRIRQFQQIGGPSVTVWRELRRLDADAQAQGNAQRELIEHPRSAADRGLWSVFWLLQGGPETLRQAHSLKPFYETTDRGRYGDQRRRVKGVCCTTESGTYATVTRQHEWKVQRAGKAEVDMLQAEWRHHLNFRRTNVDFIAAYERAEAQRSSEAASTWTGVNNCTATKRDDYGAVSRPACTSASARPERGGLADLSNNEVPKLMSLRMPLPATIGYTRRAGDAIN